MMSRWMLWILTMKVACLMGRDDCDDDALVGVQAGALSVVQVDEDGFDFDVNAFTLLP